MQKLAEICVRRPVFATVIILLLTVIGGFSFFTLGVDRFPKIDLPTVNVSTTLQGAAPEEMETEVTDVIEGVVNTVPGIDEMRSTSSQGRSQVTITFNLEKDPDVATQEVRDKVSTVVNRLPETADAPVVTKSDPDSQPVIQYAISAPRSSIELTDLVQHQIQDRLESADGVGEVVVYGGRQREIKVYINPDRLRAYNLSVTDVVGALRAQNLEVPGGTLNEGAKVVALRTMSRVQKVEEFNQIVVANRNKYPVKLSDVGRIEDSGADPTSAASLNGTASVSLAVRKQSGANTVAVIGNIKQRMAEIQPLLPKDLKIAVTRDQSEFIETSLHAIEEHLVVGGLLAALIVFLFLWNFRSTLIAALAIPTSIISAFALIAWLGYSLNQMTMLSLTLMVGIVIDDAIVVLENIYRFVEEKGMHPYQAAIEGTREIGLAVMATTLSLLAVFIPVGFMTGIVGRFMSSFGLTSAAAIAVSLIVSFTLTPMLAARWIKPPKDALTPEGMPLTNVDAAGAGGGDANNHHIVPGHANPNAEFEEDEAHGAPPQHHSSKEGRFYKPIDRTYTWMLKWSMAHRWLIVAVCVLVVASIVPLYRWVGYNFLPDEDESAFQVSLRMPQGTSLAATQSVLDRIARDIREQIPGVQDTLALAGFGRGGGPNSGSINVSLKPVKERDSSQTDLIQRTRQMIQKRKYPKEFQISVSGTSSIGASIGLGRGGSSVGYFISGPEMQKLDDYSKRLVERLKQDDKFREPDRSLLLGNPELRVVIDRQRAGDLGVKAGDVSQALNTLAAGQRVTTFSENSEQYDVVVQAEEEHRRTRDSLKDFTVASSTIGTVSLDKLVELQDGNSPASIDRINRQRQVTVSAGVAPGASESDAVDAMQRYVQELKIEPGYRTGVTGQSKELARANQSFLLAFLLSFIFMYLILAAQFESFIHPVTILLTLPLSVPFALLSTLIAGQRLNIFSALGILLLFGIVKKNAILQIDHTNELRAHGMERYSAIVQANRDRLRPILMTTIALVAGMIPLIIGSGAGAATNRSIGVLVVGGQSLCLLLTLLAVPVFYSLFEDAKESSVWASVGTGFNNFGGGLRSRAAAAYANVAGGLSRKTKPTAEALRRQDQKDRYADQASGD
ncbi:MAG: hydrophobic/amphiphilic exporter (mainly bacteria), family [Acidobacteriota bacterium]|jgi:HAE1 family hydrophobic/amphiphilic exporter-1|nr:hydrophobic/amphiphilic exporter (mainly bacteria), family [Acidobacteriota bacterium]